MQLTSGREKKHLIQTEIPFSLEGASKLDMYSSTHIYVNPKDYWEASFLNCWDSSPAI